MKRMIWEPVPDGDVLPEKFGKSNFQVAGGELTMASEGTVIWADLPADIRLCRLTETDVPSVPDEMVIGLLKELLHKFLSEVRAKEMIDFPPDQHTAMRELAEDALLWLDEQAKGGE